MIGVSGLDKGGLDFYVLRSFFKPPIDGLNRTAVTPNLNPMALRDTPAGAIAIRSNCTPESIRNYDFEAILGSEAREKQIFRQQETLEARAADAETNVVLAATDNQTVVGFGVFSPPDSDDRWSWMTPGVIMEVEVLEVHRRFRACHIASDIIGRMLAHSKIETMIAFMVGFSWTWDLTGTGLDAASYRDMLLRLFGPHGFDELKTNEPNVCMRPENLFMARVGHNLSDALREEFKYLRFGIPPTGS